MAKRTNNILDTYDRAVVGATVTVYTQANVIAICTDDLGNPINTVNNPIITDAAGIYSYNANDDYYREHYTRGGTTLAPDEIVKVGTPAYNPPVNAASITYLATGTGTVTRTVQTELDERGVNIIGRGADPTGVATNTAAAIIAALTASNSKTIWIPDGTYNFGDANGGVLCDLSSFGDGITFRCGRNVTFLVHTTHAEITALFRLDGNNNFTCGPIKVVDSGGDPTVQNKGVFCFQLLSSSASCGNHRFESIDLTNGEAAISIEGNSATNRVRGVDVGTITATDSYRGFIASNNGDAVRIGQIVALRCVRAYFVYGIIDHSVKILNRNPRFSTGAVNICRQVGGFDTRNISVVYTSREGTIDLKHVNINHIDRAGGAISNIRITVDIEGSVTYTAVQLTNYDGSGTPENSGASSNVVTDVTISGRVDSNARPIAAVASYGSVGTLQIADSTSLSWDTTVSDKFALNRPRAPQSTKTTNFTLDLTQTGQVYYTGPAATASIPTNAAAAFPIGVKIEIVNNGSGALAIARNSGVALKWSPGGTDADRSLAVGGVAMLRKVATDTWFISGAGLS